MSRDISLYIKDILQNMSAAEEFIQGFSYDQFASDKKTLNAAMRSMEVIGEAAKKVPDEIRAKYPSVPWKEMAGMRDKLIPLLFRCRSGGGLAGRERPYSYHQATHRANPPGSISLAEERIRRHEKIHITLFASIAKLF